MHIYSEKAMAPHSSTFAWKVPWTEGPGGLQFVGLDKTERLHFHFSLLCIGEGNGNPLQCSCLENPRDGGAWWVAVYGVAQSRTRLKRRSSSISIYISCVCVCIYVYSSVCAKGPMSLPRMITEFSYIRITIRYYSHQINLLIDNGFWVHSKRDTMARSPLIGKKALCGRGTEKM